MTMIIQLYKMQKWWNDDSCIHYPILHGTQCSV